MNLHRRRIVAMLASTPFLAPLAARAQVAELNPPRPVATDGKIEVLEFFWYGCIHCYNLEPRLEVWLKKLPKDVEFRRVPAVLSRQWGHDATIFYTFEAMGLLDKLHRPFFEAIHRDRLRTDNAQAFNAWLGKYGIDPKKFEAVAKSFSVVTNTQRAVQMTIDYDIRGTPAMAVHGRYTVGSDEAMLQTVDKLVAAIRKNK
jgi:thiol:disulfide interchange protein DsbA